MTSGGKGFIFKSDRCVACGACAAACVIENRWKVRPRSILTFNEKALPGLPLFNLSIACNHCKKALCLEGCPSSAYSRDENTSAVLIDDSKCLGCRYCQWNCPYDSPKFDTGHGVIGKCSLCNHLISEGLNPACASACPTGALSYGIMPAEGHASAPAWFPDRDMQPAIFFSGDNKEEALRIEPPSRFSDHQPGKSGSATGLPIAWSLVLFSLISSAAVAYIVYSVLSGLAPAPALLMILLASAALASLFHLGRPSRAWRALSNPKTSPLSREIWGFIVFSGVSVLSSFIQLPVLPALSMVTGFAFLLLVDGIYFYADARKNVHLNSGQTLLSTLLIASFLTGEAYAFVFIAALRFILTVIKLLRSDTFFSLRFIRLFILIVSAIAVAGKAGKPDLLIFVIFLAGELCDRILFYKDFSPLSLSNEIMAPKTTI